jgi:hypothetical protein
MPFSTSRDRSRRFFHAPRRFARLIWVGLGLSAAPAGAASIRPDGRLEVGGEAMFPVGLVELGTYRYADWQQRIRDSGANIVWDIEIAYADTTPGCAQVLQAAEDGDWYLMLGSGDTWNWDDLSTPEYEVNQMMYEPAELASLLDCVEAHPNRVIGFANRDEPGWTLSRNMIGDIDEPHIHDTYSQLRDAAPNTFVAMNHAPAHLTGNLEAWKAEVASFAAATDVVMFASYPYPAGPGTCTSWNVLGYPDCKMDRLPISTDLFVGELNRPGQPIWMIVQAHKGIPLKEARWEAWASVVHGATGLFWAGWNWYHPQGTGAANWPITRQVMSEVSALESFLLGQDLPGAECNQPDVEVRVLQAVGANQALAVAIARNGFTGTASIRLPHSGPGKATVLYENRRVNISNDRISDQFVGYEAHLYRYQSSRSGQVPTDSPELAGVAAPFSIEAFPNPSAGRTTARFSLSRPATVLFRVYDAAGRRVAAIGRGSYGAGTGEVVWSGRNEAGHDVAPGVYFVRGTTSSGEEASARILIRR